MTLAIALSIALALQPAVADGVPRDPEASAWPARVLVYRMHHRGSRAPARVDVVTALHACNTATDDAIRFALDRQARHVVLVPCCQAEVAAALRARKAVALSASPLAELWRHPIHTRELGSHLSNVLRCLLLESHGYKVTVTELVGWEHSMKNELIVATRNGGKKASARQRAEWLLREFGLESLRPRFLY